ncbi:guanine nucleotide exchange protein smcr8b [Alosa pseudoharengus]|uniref:guanine nucleotide exchange protein smcr8b n=1 Tax=Alosa pseudoharengus TaxID=34774 RepID=UPI003F8CCCB4
MIGSSDILALARGHKQLDSRTQRSSTLPDHLSLPPLTRPWHPGPSHNDSVLLCEFRHGASPDVDRPRIGTASPDVDRPEIRIGSEVGMETGLEPRLLFITPKLRPDLDLVLRLLKDGYQATRGEGWDQSDSWMLLGDAWSGVFVYAHYVTLVNPRARGRVWPFAMALVSHDSVKLVKEIQELNKAFSQLSHTLKTQHTPTHPHTPFSQLSHTLKTQHTHTHPHTPFSQLSHTLKTQHTPTHPHTPFSQLSHTLKTQHTHTHPHTPFSQLSHTLKTKHTLHHTDRVVENTHRALHTEIETTGINDTHTHLTLDSLCAIQLRFRDDASLLAHQRECASLLPRLSATNFLFEDPPPPQQHTSPSNPLHDDDVADVSCVEAVPIKLEVSQSHGSPGVHVTTLPTQDEEDGVSMETGSNSSGDSIEVLATERSLRDDPVAMERSLRDDPVAMERSLRGDPVAMERSLRDDPMETSWVPAVQQPVAVASRWGAQRTDSQDSSIEVLSRDHSFLWEDFRPADGLPHGLMGTVVQEEEEEEDDWQGDVRTVVQEEEDLAGNVGSFQDNAEQHGFMGTVVQHNAEQQRFMGTVVQDNAEQQRFMGTVVQDNEEQQRFMGTVVRECRFSLCTPTKPDLHLHDVSQEACPLHLHDDMSQEVCPLARLLPLCPIGQKDRDSALPSCASWRCGRDKGNAALGLVRSWGHAHHAVFSLLIGRPLVVLGSDEEKVRGLVLALELFLPNTHTPTHTRAHTHTNTHTSTHTPTHRVLPWCSRPIQITDLLEFGIIGLNRRSCQSSPSMPLCLQRYARYLSILDADHMTLRCPAYHGALIGPLTKPQSQLREGGTYALLVQSALTRLAARAFHHVFTGHEAEPSPGATDDIRILEFLCDIIKLRLTHHAPSSVLRFSYQPCTLFR